MDLRFLVRRLLSHMGLGKLIGPLIYFTQDICFLKRMTFNRIKKTNTFTFYLDPDFKHPGLADRLRAIVGCYYIASRNNFEFQIVFNEPFALKDYLIPNKVNWISFDSSFSVWNTSFFTYDGIFRKIKKGKNYVCFNYSGNLLDVIDDRTRFCDLFSQLFKPSPVLLKMIEDTELLPQTYIAIHLRFVNAFSKFEKSMKSQLTSNQQLSLLQRCRSGIDRICLEHPSNTVVVFSDSSYFLNNISDLSVEVLDTSSINHIAYTNNQASIMKAFLDFFIISRAKKVYRILADEMYKSNYSSTAALVGNIDFFDYYV